MQSKETKKKNNLKVIFFSITLFLLSVLFVLTLVYVLNDISNENSNEVSFGRQFNFYERAKSEYFKGNVEKALRILSSKDNTNDKYLKYKADMLEASIYVDFDIRRAERLFAQILQNELKDEYLYYNIGRMYEKFEDIKKSTTYYKKSIKKNNKFIPAYIALGNMYYNKNIYKTALKYYQEALKYDKNNDKIKLHIGLLHYELSNIRDATKVLSDIASSDDRDIAYISSAFLGNILSARGQYFLAKEMFSRALKNNPKSEIISYNLAVLNFFDREPSKGINILLKANGDIPNSYLITETLAKVYYLEKEYSNAIEYYKKLADISIKTNYKVVSIIADLHYQNGEFEAAKVEYEKVLKFKKYDDIYYNAILNLGNIYYDFDNLDLALEMYELLLENRSYDYAVNFNLGVLSFDENNRKGTLEHLLKAYNAAPYNQKPLIVIAEFYDSVGEKKKALNYYAKSEQISKNNVDLLFNIALFHLSVNDKLSAKKYFEYITNISTENNINERAYINLGIINSELNRNLDAVALFEKAVDINTRSTLAYYNLGMHYYKNKDYVKALDKLNLLTTHKPDNKLSSLIYLSIGNIFFKLREPNKAFASYKMATNYDPYSVEANHNIEVVRSIKW